MYTCHPVLETDNPVIDRAFRLALGDFYGNIAYYQGGKLPEPAPVIAAGLGYDMPWTRDTAFNCWFAGAALAPEAARNTLLAVLQNKEPPAIGGEYWDAIIWAKGAWEYYLATGDREFMQIHALPAIENSLDFFERTERDSADGLFRGGACFQDGVAAYPDKFVNRDFDSGIIHAVKYHPDFQVPTGVGIPVKALSTNCLYLLAYRIVNLLRQELALPPNPQGRTKADALATAIRARFRLADGRYHYLLDADDEDWRQEGMGYAFAILAGVIRPDEVKWLIANVIITKHGIPCVWPTYRRYATLGEHCFGRHSGMIWPQVNALWALALSECGDREKAWTELEMLAQKAVRDGQFYELYHPESGLADGGWQENATEHTIIAWKAQPRQTWCATGFLKMVLTVLLGADFQPDGITFSPWLPAVISRLTLQRWQYRNLEINIDIQRTGTRSSPIKLQGDACGKATLNFTV